MSKSKFSKAIGAIAIGMPLRRACTESGITNQQLYRAMARDADLAGQYARAKEVALDAMADDLLAIADDGSNDTYADDDGNVRVDHDVVQRSKLRVDTRKWLMSKLAPKKWGDKLEVAGAPGAPLTVQIVRFSDIDPAAK